MISKSAAKASCPVCSNEKIEYFYSKLDALGSLLRCTECGLYFIWPDLSSTGNAQVYDERYYDNWSPNELGFAGLSEMKQSTFEHLFDLIAVHKQEGTLLDVGCAFGDLLSVAAKRGWTGYGTEISAYAAKEAKRKIGAERIEEGDFLKSGRAPGMFDVVTMVDLVEHVYEAKALFQKCRYLLKENGFLVIVTPNIDSLSRKIMGKGWPHFKREHPIYFSGKSITRSLSANGFKVLEASSFKKTLNLYYIIAQLSAIEKAVFIKYLAKMLGVLLPGLIKKKNFFLPHGEMLIIAQKK